MEDVDSEPDNETPGSHLRSSFFHMLFGYPLLIVIGAFMAFDMIMYLITRKFVAFYEKWIVFRGQRGCLNNRLDNSTSYDQWKRAAKEMDELLGNDAWKQSKSSSKLFDETLINEMYLEMNTVLSKRTSKESKASSLADILARGCIKSNVGGIEAESLYSHCYLGTKSSIQKFIDVVNKSLDFITENASIETRHAFGLKAKLYGKTALCLSGGVGVVKALLDQDCLPSIISGTSSGSLMASMICVRTDNELLDILSPSLAYQLSVCESSWSERINLFKKTGAMFDAQDWILKAEKLLLNSSMTFLEAFKKTGRVLNISVVPDENHAPSKQLNYITTPDVIISSAVIASSAIPGLLNPVELLMKKNGKITPYRGVGRKWRDGSLNTDIPEKDLHILFDVNYTIVSQVNPHIVVFFYERHGSAGCPTPHRYGRGYRGGFVGSALTQHFKLDLQKWMLLIRDLDLLPRILGSDFSHVFLQNFEGSITIVPNAPFSDYFKVLTDPSYQRLEQFLVQGQQMCWPKIQMIKNRLAIERKLEKLLIKDA